MQTAYTHQSQSEQLTPLLLKWEILKTVWEWLHR